eukprot:scaffold89039_cov20-Prasinocladus_malaysianus.AAC.1
MRHMLAGQRGESSGGTLLGTEGMQDRGGVRARHRGLQPHDKVATCQAFHPFVFSGQAYYSIDMNDVVERMNLSPQSH